MKVVTKNYNGADKIIPNDIFQSTISSLENIQISLVGREYSEKILEVFRNNGWSLNISISAGSKAKINGIKNNVGLVVFLGNHYYCYHYLLNLQYLYVNNKISSAIFITQTKNQAIRKNQIKNPKTISTGNFIEFEKLTEDFDLYSQFISIPLAVIAFEEEMKR
jgi:hypothetical protein